MKVWHDVILKDMELITCRVCCGREEAELMCSSALRPNLTSAYGHGKHRDPHAIFCTQTLQSLKQIQTNARLL